MSDIQNRKISKAYLKFYTTNAFMPTIPEEKVLGFSFGTSIYEGYPVGEVIIEDSEGKVINNLGLSLGDFIYIATAMENSETLIESAPFVVVSIESISEDNLGKYVRSEEIYKKNINNFSGVFRVKFVYPWAIYNDNTNKAYKGLSSDILYNIIGEALKRGIKLDVEEIETTDASPISIRYKIDKSELDFFIEDVLPYTTINNKPAYFFINDIGKIYLNNFQNLFKKSPKVMFMPPILHINNPTSSSTKLDINKKEYKDLFFIEVYDLYINIAKDYEEFLSRVIGNLNLSDPLTGTSFKISFGSKIINSGFTLINKNYLQLSKGSYTKSYDRRLLKDEINQHIFKMRKLNEFFELQVITEYCFGALYTGETVLVNMQSIDENIPWLNGRYLVAETDHFKRDNVLFSKFTLIKPALFIKDTLEKDKVNLQDIKEDIRIFLQKNCIDFENF